MEAAAALAALGAEVVRADLAEREPTLAALAGATAVQIGTQNFVDPFVWSKVLDGLADYITRHHVAKLSDLVGAFDPTLGAALAKSRAKITHQVEKLRKKMTREALRRDQRAAAEAEYLGNLIYPHKHLQERLYSILPFLAKHGMDLPEQIFNDARLDCPDHRILSF